MRTTRCSLLDTWWLVAANAREIARVFFERGHDRLVAGESLRLRTIDTGEHTLVVLRQYLDELRHGEVPLVEQQLRAGALRVVEVILDELAHRRDLLGAFEFLDADHLRVDALG